MPGWTPGDWGIETDGTHAEPLAREMMDAVWNLEHDRFMSYWHEDCVIEFPNPVPGIPQRIVGLEQWKKVEELSFSVPERTITEVVFLPLGDPSWVLCDHHIEHRFPWEDGLYSANHLNVIAAREGKIVYMREYMNTLELTRATRNRPPG